MNPVFRIVLGEVLLGLLGVVVVGALVAWYASGELVAALPRYVGHPPTDLPVSNATFSNGSDSLVHGWVARGDAGKGAVLLLHGVHGDRREMVPRAEFLHRLGYTVLVIDLQSHGESRGPHVSFGLRESRDVAAAIAYMHYTLPDERIGVVGVSLGAAAFALADHRPPVDAVVVESLYPTLKNAVASRLRQHMGPLGRPFAPLMTFLVRLRLGASRHPLDMEDHMAHIGAPLLMASGATNPDIPIETERALFAAAPEPKEFWEVSNAGDVDLYTVAKAEYERRIAAFLGAHLPSAQKPANAATRQAPPAS